MWKTSRLASLLRDRPILEMMSTDKEKMQQIKREINV